MPGIVSRKVPNLSGLLNASTDSSDMRSVGLDLLYILPQPYNPNWPAAKNKGNLENPRSEIRCYGTIWFQVLSSNNFIDNTHTP